MLPLLMVLLAQTPVVKSQCHPFDFNCIKAEQDDAQRTAQQDHTRKHKPVQTPQCPMWVESTFNAECV